VTKISSVDKTRKWLTWQRLLSGRKDCSTTNHENLATIGLVDFEIIGLTEIVKANIKFTKTAAEHISRAPQTCFQQPGGLNKSVYPCPSDHSLRRWPLLLSGAGRCRSIAGKRRDWTDGHQPDALTLAASVNKIVQCSLGTGRIACTDMPVRPFVSTLSLNQLTFYVDFCM